MLPALRSAFGDFEILTLYPQAAADATSKITGGKLDVLINNAGLVSPLQAFKNVLQL
jgi:hypothetical protein